MSALVTLTTDYGTRDSYVAQLKGVLRSRCPEATVLDLTHAIAPQDRVEAALFLAGAVPTFPPGTIHLAVVDPGVGSDRRALAVEVAGQRVVCPDNGLLTLLLRTHSIEAAYELTNPALQRQPVSATFEGRDVFAPAAAHLAGGDAITELGPPASDLVGLPIAAAEQDAGGVVRGEVVHVDLFGNAITNIPASMLAPAAGPRVRTAGHDFALLRAYGDARPGEALAVIGSSDHLEVAVREGNAAVRLGLQRGDRVEVSPA